MSHTFTYSNILYFVLYQETKHMDTDIVKPDVYLQTGDKFSSSR